jgi:hypothetical protein
LLAAGAELDGVRQQAGAGIVRRRGICVVRAGQFWPVSALAVAARSLDEPSGEVIATCPGGQVGFLACGLACLQLSSARWLGPAGQCREEAPDAVHGDLLVGWAGRVGGGLWRLIPLLAAAAVFTTRDGPRDSSHN